LYDTLSYRPKPSGNGNHFGFAWIVGILDNFHQYNIEHSMGWQNAMDVKIGFKLQVTGTPRFH